VVKQSKGKIETEYKVQTWVWAHLIKGVKNALTSGVKKWVGD
jgi:hypothetical protein